MPAVQPLVVLRKEPPARRRLGVIGCIAHTVPALVVARGPAEPDAETFPMAQPVWSLTKLTARRDLAPAGGACSTQVTPALAVVTMAAVLGLKPTAHPEVLVGKSTAISSSTCEGTTCSTQVVPPLTVAIATPALPPSVSILLPTAQP